MDSRRFHLQYCNPVAIEACSIYKSKSQVYNTVEVYNVCMKVVKVYNGEITMGSVPMKSIRCHKE